MSKTHLIHGAFVTGEPAIQGLAPYTPGPDRLHKYGFAMPPFMLFANWKTVRDIADKVADGDVLIGHSNGCLIVNQIVEHMQTKGRTPGAVILIAPAMRRDTVWPAGDYRVLCIHNPMDWVVELGRVWGRLFEQYTAVPHGWGSAGRHGFTGPDPRVSNWAIRRKGLKQHSITPGLVAHAGPMIRRWLDTVLHQRMHAAQRAG